MPSGFPTDPKLATAEMKKAGASAIGKFPGVKYPWKCRCNSCRQIIWSRLADVRNGHRPCNFCAKKASGFSKRVNKEVAVKELIDSGMKPLVSYPGAGKPWKCRCLNCGKIGNPRLASIRRGHAGCKSCANNGRGMNDSELAKTTMIKKGKVIPLVDYPGNATPWLCRCLRCGSEVTPVYSSVVSSGRGGCKFCGKKDGAKTRTTPSSRAIKEMIKSGATPIVPFTNTKTPWKSKCNNCGNIIYPALGNARSGAGPCKFCAEHGFSYQKRAIVYLLHNQKEKAYKVGVSGFATGRIEMLQKLGWQVLKSTHVGNGERAIKVERKIFAQLLLHGARIGSVPKTRMPRGGHTETIDERSITRKLMLKVFKQLTTRK